MSRPRTTTSESASSSHQDTGDAGGDVLADRVTDHRRRTDAPLHPQAGECVLDGEESGLGEVGLLQPLRRFLRAPRPVGRRMEHVPHVETELGTKQLRTAINRFAEHRLGLVQLAAHLDVLRALPRKQERD